MKFKTEFCEPSSVYILAEYEQNDHSDNVIKISKVFFDIASGTINTYCFNDAFQTHICSDERFHEYVRLLDESYDLLQNRMKYLI